MTVPQFDRASRAGDGDHSRERPREVAGTDVIPVTIVTGSPGAGKSSWINRVLRDPALARTLVVVCELGTTPVAHPLLAHAGRLEQSMGATGDTPGTQDRPAVLRNLCQCCREPADLVQVLSDAGWRFARGGQRLFDRVFIETAGGSDPLAVAGRLDDRRLRNPRYRPEQIVTLVAGLPTHRALSVRVAGDPS